MTRRVLLALAVAALAVALVLDRRGGREPSVVEAAAPRASMVAPTAAMGDPASQRPDRGLAALVLQTGDPFHPAPKATVAVAPPKVAKPAEAESAPPAPPGVPFKYLGAIAGPHGRPAHCLTEGEALIEIEVGTVLQALWRVEAIAEAEVRLVYLPLAQSQSLPIAAR